MGLPQLQQPVSQLCTQSQFDEPHYLAWCEAWRQPRIYKRKQWEFVYIWRVLQAHGLLSPGRMGIGFGVGKEPLAAMLAAYEVNVLATDMPGGEQAWGVSNQHAAGVSQLRHEGICTREKLREHVLFRGVDMNAIPADLRQGQFDFAWSASALDHLGTLERGLDFIRASLECVKPGGVVVHTTEYNVSSESKTMEQGPVVLYRERDIRAFASEMQAAGHRMTLNLARGDGPHDRFVDRPPYQSPIHLRMEIGGHITTSIGLTVTKGGA